MVKKQLLFYAFIIIFIASLLMNVFLYYKFQNNKETTFQKTESIEENVKQLTYKWSRTNGILESLIEKTTKENDDFISKLHSLESSSVMQAQDEIEIQKIYKIIDKLPQVSKKLAFIKQIENENGQYYLILDYIDWFSGDEAKKAAEEDKNPDAPSLNNGFYIRNKAIENDKVTIGKDVMIFVLDGAKLNYIDFNDFISTKTDIQNILCNIRYVGNEIVLLEEQYTP